MRAASTRLVPLSRPLLLSPVRQQRGRRQPRLCSERRRSAGPVEAAAGTELVDSLSSASVSLLSTSTMAFFHLTEGEKHALTLSTLAGLSTTVGALIAIVRRPDAADLALLLGLALGVMSVLSFAEMWVRNAAEHGFLPVTLAFVGGALAYALLSPLLPEVEAERFGIGGGGGVGASVGKRAEGEEGEKLAAAAASSSSVGSKTTASSRGGGDGRSREGASDDDKRATVTATTDDDKRATATATTPSASEPLNPAQLLRLGVVVSVAMTLHNFPEGFAVAFSSFTPLGAVMASAIAAHNVPEGVVVAAPVFAATGSRLAALGLAAASGMSEPLGAAAALFVARPWTRDVAAGGGGAADVEVEARLALVLAVAGGIMASVCLVDLYPQGRKCNAPGRLAAGTALGAVAMALTLALGV